jgi:hypothetical protein
MGEKEMIKKIALISTILTLSLYSHSNAEETETINFVYNCKVFQGKHVTHDFKSSVVTAGPILKEKYGDASLSIRFLGEKGRDGAFFALKLSPSKVSHYFGLTSSFVAMQDRLVLPSNGGDVIYLSRIYKNEWYGAMTFNQFVDNEHSLFYSPIKCIIDTTFPL